MTWTRPSTRCQPIALSLFRFITGLLLFQYGIAKIFKFPALPYFDNIPPLITIAGVIELMLRRAADARAVHAPGRLHPVGRNGVRLFPRPHVQGRLDAPVFHPLFNGGTAAILFCFACLYLATAGGGPWSLDAMLRKKG